MRPLLALVVMVKDEADSIRALLESALPHVDCALVHDTWSSDDTVKIAREVLAERGCVDSQAPLAYELRSGRKVFDFAANRNYVLETIAQLPEERRPVFTLFLSGHETLRGGAKLREFLEQQRDAADGAYSIRVESHTRAFGYPRVLRVDAGWRYVNVVHEVPQSPTGERAAPECPGMITHAPPESDLGRKIDRLRNLDLPVLEERAEDETAPMGARADAIRMLGETHALLASEHARQASADKETSEERRAAIEGAKQSGGPWLYHQMAAMACLFRYAVLAEDSDPEMAHYALATYYQLAGDITWMYTPEELFTRLLPLSKAAPDSVEMKYLVARSAVLGDPRQGLPFALQAAKAAKDAAGKTRRAPLDTSLVWRTLLMAAECAKAIAEEAKSQEERVSKIAQARRFFNLAVKEGAPFKAEEENEQKGAQ